jgi:hypothetical protein
MASFFEFRGPLDTIIGLLKKIEKHLCCLVSGGGGGETLEPSAGTGSIPAGFRSIAIVRTSSADDVTITLADATTYIMTAEGEVFEDGIESGLLPAYTITGPGTWKWHGIK